MDIRDERPGDEDAVYEVVRAAFGQADEAELVRSLHRDGDAVVSLVAEDQGRIIGHVMLSRMSGPLRALALAPVSAAPDRQGRGVGSALVRAAIARARQAGWEAIFVLGEPAYYNRFGFEGALAAAFSSAYAGGHFMALALTTPLPATSGALAHAPAFAALD